MFCLCVMVGRDGGCWEEVCQSRNVDVVIYAGGCTGQSTAHHCSFEKNILGIDCSSQS